jgi:hypothetical protein
MSKMLQMVQRLADRLRGSRPDKVPSMPRSGVLLHDPAASRPRDLDNPYLDAKVQERVAKVIAVSARKTQSD